MTGQVEGYNIKLIAKRGDLVIPVGQVQAYWVDKDDRRSPTRPVRTVLSCHNRCCVFSHISTLLLS